VSVKVCLSVRHYCFLCLPYAHFIQRQRATLLPITSMRFSKQKWILCSLFSISMVDHKGPESTHSKGDNMFFFVNLCCLFFLGFRLWFYPGFYLEAAPERMGSCKGCQRGRNVASASILGNAGAASSITSPSKARVATAPYSNYTRMK
jgi:hypothetical protein